MRVVLPVLMLLVAGAAAAQERPPPERQALLDLSYALGQAHALRQVCDGPDDQYWRQRMVRLTEVEAADQTFDAQLRDRFNTGFASSQAQHVACDAESRRAEAAAAARGQALAARLAAVIRTLPPDERPLTPGPAQ